MIVEVFPVAPLGCNCVVLGDPHTKRAWVFDPGGELNKILACLAKHELKCIGIAHTHAHFDHVSAAYELQEETGAPVLLHEQDLFLFNNLQMQLDAFGMPFKAPPVPEVDRFIRDGDDLALGELSLHTLHTPGHSPGSVCFSAPALVSSLMPKTNGLLLAGDTLFKQSIGRSDLWGGDQVQLLDSLQQRVLNLDEDTLVIPGHGPLTTIGDECRSNPFIGS